MKRYSSFDFMRGAAILGVLCFHLLNVTYNKNAALDAATANPGNYIPFLILAALLAFLGSFDKLFIILSAVVNTVTIRKQWKRMEERGLDKAGKRKAFNKILVSQIFRGVFIIFVGYLSDVVLNGFLLNALIQDPTTVYDSIEALWVSNILEVIGWGILVSSVGYLIFLNLGKSDHQIKYIMAILAILTLVLYPIINNLLLNIPGFTTSPGQNWNTRSFGVNLLFFFLAPITMGPQPIFPYVSMAFIGVIVGLDVSRDKIEKKNISRDILISVLLVIAGVIAGLLRVAFNLPIDDLDNFFIASGGALLLLILVFYLIEIRGKGDGFSKKTVWFRRFGLVTLSLWALQWIMIFPAFLFFALVVHEPVGDTLTGYQLLLLLLIVVAMWYVIVRLWEFANFKGGFEWLTVKILSRERPNAGERLKLSSSLYNVESPIKEGQKFYGKGKIAGLLILWFVFAFLFAIFTLLLT